MLGVWEKRAKKYWLNIRVENSLWDWQKRSSLTRDRVQRAFFSPKTLRNIYSDLFQSVKYPMLSTVISAVRSHLHLVSSRQHIQELLITKVFISDSKGSIVQRDETPTLRSRVVALDHVWILLDEAKRIHIPQKTIPKAARFVATWNQIPRLTWLIARGRCYQWIIVFVSTNIQSNCRTIVIIRQTVVVMLIKENFALRRNLDRSYYPFRYSRAEHNLSGDLRD